MLKFTTLTMLDNVWDMHKSTLKAQTGPSFSQEICSEMEVQPVNLGISHGKGPKFQSGFTSKKDNVSKIGNGAKWRFHFNLKMGSIPN